MLKKLRRKHGIIVYERRGYVIGEDGRARPTGRFKSVHPRLRKRKFAPHAAASSAAAGASNAPNWLLNLAAHITALHRSHPHGRGGKKSVHALHHRIAAEDRRRTQKSAKRTRQ